MVKKALKHEVKKVYLWSDSTITLHWIENPPENKLYEANRVYKIRKLTNNCEWRHIPTVEHPADVLSRETTVQKLISHDLWWHGLQWLASSSEWPTLIIVLKIEDPLVAAMLKKISELKVLLKFSRYLKLRSVIAYCHKARDIWKKRDVIKGPLTLKEIDAAERRVLLWVQAGAFRRDIRRFKADKCIDGSSPLQRLSPYLDEHGLIRVEGAF